MGNFKVRVNSEAESREVQDLLVKMGYHARANWSERNPIHESIQAWSDGEFTFSLNHNKVPVGFKEITLPELRAMVKPSLNDQYAEIEQVRQHRHYFIDVSDVDEIDFYEIALRYNVTDPCIQHILKKCLAVGQRGQKDFHHDLKDIYDTAKRMLDVHGLDS